MRGIDRRMSRGNTSGSGLSGVDVADDDHVDMHLFFTAVKSNVSRSLKERNIK